MPDKAVAVIGDGTFFHSGVGPADEHGAQQPAGGTVVILDNKSDRDDRAPGSSGGRADPLWIGLGGGENRHRRRSAARWGVDDVRQVERVRHEGRGTAAQVMRRRTRRPSPSSSGRGLVSPARAGAEGPARSRRRPLATAARSASGSVAPRSCGADESGREDGAVPKADIDPVLCINCDMCRQICPPQGHLPSRPRSRVTAERRGDPQRDMKSTSDQSARHGRCPGSGRRWTHEAIQPTGDRGRGPGHGGRQRHPRCGRPGLVGYNVKKSDASGLAIRGGSVISHVRWGDHRPLADHPVGSRRRPAWRSSSWRRSGGSTSCDPDGSRSS